MWDSGDVPSKHSTNRKFEWAAALIMVQMGLGILLAPVLELQPFGAFLVLTEWGLTHFQVGMLFFLVGWLRVVALWANGIWKRHGCYCRASGCAVGVILWLQMTGGLIQATLVQHQIVMAFFFLSTFVMFEFLSFMQSIVDCRAYDGGCDDASRNS